jgi:hypothetical protein
VRGGFATPANERGGVILDVLVEEIDGLASRDDVLGFELSLGGAECEGRAYFHRGQTHEKSEGWQIPSPVRGLTHGVRDLNRLIQTNFRSQTIATARPGSVPQDPEADGTGRDRVRRARLLLAQSRTREAKALLVELEEIAGVRADPYYASVLPALARAALTLGEPELAARLTDGVQPSRPLFEHALITAHAQLAEAGGDHAEAAVLFAEAAERWREFGNVVERAYTLLGQGRCLSAIGDLSGKEPLFVARELFASMGFAPAVAETDALLGRAEAAAR